MIRSVNWWCNFKLANHVCMWLFCAFVWLITGAFFLSTLNPFSCKNAKKMPFTVKSQYFSFDNWNQYNIFKNWHTKSIIGKIGVLLCYFFFTENANLARQEVTDRLPKFCPKNRPQRVNTYLLGMHNYALGCWDKMVISSDFLNLVNGPAQFAHFKSDTKRYKIT